MNSLQPLTWGGWKYIHPKWKYLAVDKGSEWNFYTHKPEAYSTRWASSEGDHVRVSDLIEAPLIGILKWSASLIERPEVRNTQQAELKTWGGWKYIHPKWGFLARGRYGVETWNLFAFKPVPGESTWCYDPKTTRKRCEFLNVSGVINPPEIGDSQWTETLIERT